MTTTNVGADDAPWVDGNALAGPLGEIIGTDLTVAEITCAGCRTTRPLAAMRVFDRAPGVVARCPGCEDVVMRVVRTTSRVLVDLRGSLVLSFPAPTCLSARNPPLARANIVWPGHASRLTPPGSPEPGGVDVRSD